MWQYQNTDELYHHGILGMRWGYRKQRPTSIKKSRKPINRYESKDSSRARKIKRKKLYQMSNEELRILNNRQNLERTYKQSNPSTFKKGVIAVGSVAATLGALTGIIKNSKTLYSTGKHAVEKVMKKK